jgi:hypothetical protein
MMIVMITSSNLMQTTKGPFPAWVVIIPHYDLMGDLRPYFYEIAVNVKKAVAAYIAKRIVHSLFSMPLQVRDDHLILRPSDEAMSAPTGRFLTVQSPARSMSSGT